MQKEQSSSLSEQKNEFFYVLDNSTEINDEFDFQASYNSILDFIQTHVYPNPSSNWLRIDMVSGNSLKLVSLVNQHGQAVFNSTDLDCTNLDIQVNIFEDGDYLLRLYTSRGLVIKRITIRK